MGRTATPEMNSRVSGGKRVGLLILLLAVAAKSVQLTYLLSTRADMTHQILAAQAFLDGYGVSAPSVSASDLSTTVYTPQIKWPPGYSLLIAPLLVLFGKDYILAALVLNLLAAFLLLLFGRAILRLMDVPDLFVNLFTLFSGLTLYYFQLKPSTDAIAIAFYLIAVQQALRVLKYQSRHISSLVIMTICLILAASLKYLYFPLVFILPGYLAWKGWRDRNQVLSKGAALAVLALAIALASYMQWQSTAAGKIGYIKQPERGVYWDNLQAFHPVLPASLLKPETLAPSGSPAVDLLYGIAHLGLAVALLFAFRSRRRARGGTLFPHLLRLTTLILVLTTVFLALLSLRIAPEVADDGSTWTYVQEPRYYGMIEVLMVMVLLTWMSGRAGMNRRSWIWWVPVLLLAVEAGRGLYFTANRIIRLGWEDYGWKYEERYQRSVASSVDRAKRKWKLSPVVMTGSSDWMTLRAALYTHQPYFSKSLLLNVPDSLHTRKPVLLFMILRGSDSALYAPFLSRFASYYEGKHDNFTFYAIPVHPH